MHLMHPWTGLSTVTHVMFVYSTMLDPSWNFFCIDSVSVGQLVYVQATVLSCIVGAWSWPDFNLVTALAYLSISAFRRSTCQLKTFHWRRYGISMFLSHSSKQSHVIITWSHSLHPHYYSVGDKVEKASFLCLQMLRSALPFIKVKKSSASESKSTESTSPSAILAHLCGLLDAGDTPPVLMRLAQDIIVDGVLVFFPDAEARKNYLLSMLKSVLVSGQVMVITTFLHTTYIYPTWRYHIAGYFVGC